MTPPIVVQGLSHWYGEGDSRWQALYDVSLEVSRGSLIVLTGPSGCGKSTLLTLMGALRHVQEGSVQLLGRELHGADAALQQAMRRRLGVIFQTHNLHGSLTVLQNVLIGSQVHGKEGNTDEHEAAATHLLRLLDLGHRAAYLPDMLSGGERQRVAIARALVSNPEVVLADEPTAALDSQSSQRVVNMFKMLGYERGVTTVMITHDDRIQQLADKVLHMQDGRIVSGAGNFHYTPATRLSAYLPVAKGIHFPP